MKPQIYDTDNSLRLSLQELIDVYKELGVNRIIYKQLAPNDNSKNQLYLASHITELSFMTTGDLVPSVSLSKKKKDPKRKIKYTASLDWRWLDHSGKIYSAPGSQLIYYPQYPEVRLSGFLKGSKINISKWMNPQKDGRSLGRVLIMGLHDDGKIIAYLATPDSNISKEITSVSSLSLSSVILELAPEKPKGIDTKKLLISELKRIHLKGYIRGQRLHANGELKPYSALNGGGYTLEAELGVIPNGDAEPDFHGWEIKQFAVKEFHLINSKPLTLMTPEPDGGIYEREGIVKFILKYGYPDSKRPDRYNFNGRHVCNQANAKTGLTLRVFGYNQEKNEITDVNGCIALVEADNTVAASWSFSKMLLHWKNKHAQAAYIPAMNALNADSKKTYHYGNSVRLFEGTTIHKFLAGVCSGVIYYDPGPKLENASSLKPKAKKRSQFRVKSAELYKLYNSCETIDVLDS